MQKCDTLRHSHRLSASMWRSVWPQRCNGDILVAFLCSLRCLVDWGAKLYKPIGVRFMRSNSCHKSVACMSLKHQESIRRYFTSVSHLIQQIFHPLALHLSKKKIARPHMPGMYIISSGESATLADYFPCIPHDLSWSNVRCMISSKSTASTLG